MKLVIPVVALSLVLASSGYSQDSVQVKTGWNLIGSVKAGSIPGVLSTIPDSIIVSSFFGYAPGVGYESTDTLDKGYGYWVKVAADGIIVFSTTPAIDSCKSRAFIYQGKLYNTVKIGDQCWMAENLDVGVMVPGTANQTDNDTTEKHCYDNDPLNCALYGGLYQWNEAMQYLTPGGGQGICPSGWHIPSLADLLDLASTVGAEGNDLKVVGEGTGEGAGTNTSGFSALLAGNKSPDGSFISLNFNAHFWSSTVDAVPGPGDFGLTSFNGDINLYDDYDAAYGFSVRCLLD